MDWFNPVTATGPKSIEKDGEWLGFDTKGCTHRNDAPAYSQPWYDGVPPRPGFEWKTSSKGPWPEELPVVKALILDAKKQAILTINHWADQQLKPITQLYPDLEVNSWPQQQTEAVALRANPESAAPILRGIAKTRGVELMVLVGKVEAKAEHFAILSGQVFGKRQHAEDELDNILDNKELTDNQKRVQLQLVVDQLTAQ